MTDASPALEVVPDLDGDEQPNPYFEDRTANPAKIPAFEGKDVMFTKAKLTSTASLEIDDRVFRVDEYVRMVIEGRVSAVDHKVNERSGGLERIHTIKAIDCQVLPWEDSDHAI